MRLERDVLADQSADHLVDVGDAEVEIDRPRLEHLLAAERQQLPGDGDGPVGGPLHFLDRFLGAGVKASVARQEVGIASNDGEQVIEIVGDAARQPADRLEFLRLPVLLLQRPPLADVLEHEHRPDLAVLLPDRRAGVFDREARTVFAPEDLVLGAEGGIGGESVADPAAGPRSRSLGEHGEVGPKQLRLFVAEQPQRRRVDERDPPGQVQPADALARRVQNHFVMPAEVLIGDLGVLQQLPPFELLDRPPNDRRQQFEQGAVLHQVVEGAGPELLGGPFFVAVLGQHDVRHGLVALGEAAQQFFAGHVRQLEVEEQQIGRQTGERFERGGPAAGDGGAKAVAAEVFFDEVGQPVVVVNDQDGPRGAAHGREFSGDGRKYRRRREVSRRSRNKGNTILRTRQGDRHFRRGPIRGPGLGGDRFVHSFARGPRANGANECIPANGTGWKGE